MDLSTLGATVFSRMASLSSIPLRVHLLGGHFLGLSVWGVQWGPLLADWTLQ